jgi:hypothetical protein
MVVLYKGNSHPNSRNEVMAIRAISIVGGAKF